jgi:predicted RND superfamily exporter protein
VWTLLSRLIIRYRLAFVIATVLITAFLGWNARKLEWSYEYTSIVPKDDPDMIFFNSFKKTYGEDGNIMVIGFEDEKLFKIKQFSQYQKLCEEISHIPGVNEVISLPTLKRLHKDTAQSKFVLQQVFTQEVQYQAELDSLLKVAWSVKFYDGLIFNPKTRATLIAVSLNKEYLNSIRRKELVSKVTELSNDFSTSNDMKVHFAGLPYVRYIMISAFKQEFNLLLGLSSLVTCIILFLFFRSFSSVLFTVLVIIVTVLWTGGIIVLLDYKINLLTGMLPALIVVISIPTCIYMFNKYHQELRKHGNKIKAVSRIIGNIGFVTFMTNANTAVGFFVLVFTDITVIREFGWVAGIMSLATFLISIIVIPALFLFLPDPSQKQMMHLDKKSLMYINDLIAKIVMKYRPAIYIVTAIFVVVSVYGVTKIRPIGYMVDDMPERSNIKSDLSWFESNFNGVMPLEILVDLGKKKAVYKIQNLKKLEEFESYLKQEEFTSPPISIINIIKSATQAFYNDDPGSYRIPDNSEKNFIVKYFGRQNSDMNIIRSFVDSNLQVVRFSLKVADLGTEKMDELLNGKLKAKIKEIFSDTDFKVTVTGTSLLFLKGNQFLIRDLTSSMFMAFALISLMMAFLFFDFKMILISVIPNIIPMIITAGVMGLFDIRMKISSAVIFSISFGITIDSTIHYLSKFKQEIATPGITVLEAVIKSLKEAGISMIYTSLVLICGFGIFIFSEFGSTIALGILTCLTLFFATLTNMILLPALLVTFVKKKP